MSSAKYSRMMDPLVLKSDIATPLTPIWKSLKKINWKQTFINFILPISIVLLIAFFLRSRYDQKKQLYQDYLVTEIPEKSLIY